MEDKVIVAVCGLPELYDTSSYHYRNRNKKDLTWRKVSEEVGQSEEVCRKKWKSLRDTYLKERRKDTEKRSGSAAGSGKKWKYSAVLSFLDPFVSPRETSGNMERGDEENQAAGYDHPEDQGETEAAAGQSETEPTGPFDGSEPGSLLPEPAAASASPAGPSTSAATVPTAPPRRRAQKRPREQPSEVERQLLEVLRTRPEAPAPPPRSEDELFLLSLVPSLQKLPPQTKDFVKFQIHKLIYESSTVLLNLEQLEPQ
ncbi:transcription factor Adf-1-like [Onychostoma macrolepis]|uniref:Transcription factor Adf-1 n=1 Tax=Onychostoma macrolepis TaxID=369639 RepID=A0A7J6BN50_9TELE|nr:transcription factor Adf-1-like [Onychostoma macrolepis]KAF4096414.1 hypothetical protein G5714_022383 [Onychostoma macrolepis]